MKLADDAGTTSSPMSAGLMVDDLHLHSGAACLPAWALSDPSEECHQDSRSIAFDSLSDCGDKVSADLLEGTAAKAQCELSCAGTPEEQGAGTCNARLPYPDACTSISTDIALESLSDRGFDSDGASGLDEHNSCSTSTPIFANANVVDAGVSEGRGCSHQEPRFQNDDDEARAQGLPDEEDVGSLAGAQQRRPRWADLTDDDSDEPSGCKGHPQTSRSRRCSGPGEAAQPSQRPVRAESVAPFAAKATCSGCGRLMGKASFSRRMWRRARVSGAGTGQDEEDGGARCFECSDTAAPPAVQTARRRFSSMGVATRRCAG